MKEKLEPLGYEVIDIHDKGYQFRINNTVDVYPKSQKFFDLVTKEWGTYEDVLDLLKERMIEEVTYYENHADEEKAQRVEQVIQNIERRLDSKKIVSRPRQIMAEEIIKLL